MGQFSENIVNQRFKLVYEALVSNNRIKGKSDIAAKLKTYNHVINNILKGDRNITVDQLTKLFDLFGVNANYIFGSSEDMFLAGHPANILDIDTIEGSEISVHGRNNIKLVPNLARAGDALDPALAEDEDSFPKFSIPEMEGNLWAFRIDGDSMLPTVTNGDLIVCERVESGEPLRDNQVYVVVTDVVVAKRIQQIREGSGVSKLRLISDNNAVYQPYEIDLKDIRHILKVKSRITRHAIA